LILKTLPWIERSETSAEVVECKPFYAGISGWDGYHACELRRNGAGRCGETIVFYQHRYDAARLSPENWRRAE
jgi:hypothetical protein